MFLTLKKGRDAIASFARSVADDSTILANVFAAESPSYPILPENSLVEGLAPELPALSDQEIELLTCEKLLRKLVETEPPLLKLKDQRSAIPSISGTKLVGWIKRLVACCFILCKFHDISSSQQ